MAREKTVFIAFAKEDEAKRNLFSGQKVHSRTPFKFTDMSVKKAYDRAWKTRTRTRIRRSDGVIVLVSSWTRVAVGQLWEIKCAREEETDPRHLDREGVSHAPSGDGAIPIRNWTWDNVARFIDSL